MLLKMSMLNMIVHRTLFYNLPGPKLKYTQKCFYNAMGSTAKWKVNSVMFAKSSGMSSHQFTFSLLNCSKFFPACRQYRTLWKNQALSRVKCSKNFSLSKRWMSKTAAEGSVRRSNKFSRAELRRLFSLAKPEKWKLTGGICMLLISSAVTMTVPFGLGKVIDVIYTADTKKMKENLNKICGILAGVFVIGGLCNFGRVYLMSIAGQRITQDLRQKVFKSILSQEVAFFDKKKTGELVNRLSADTALVSQSLTTNISDGLRSSVMVAAGVSMMFYMSPQLATVGLSVVPPVAALAIIYGRFVRKITVKVQDSLATATSIAQERISSIRTVKAFSNEPREIRAYGDQINYVLDLAYKESLARGVFFGMTGLTGNIIVLTVFYYGGTMVGTSSLTIGSLTSFLLYAFYVGFSFGGLSSFYSELNKSLGASTRLWEIIDKVPAIPMSGGITPSLAPKGRIAFKNVTFAYPTRKGTPVLQNLNLDIPEGCVTAIVGHSGSGKSTIASVLLRLYDPDEGHILIDDFETVKLNPEWIRKNVGFVSQEPVLFSSSIRDNILYGAFDPSAVTEEKLLSVAKEANCLEFIQRTPQGFDTKVGERGVMLSGGQKQRIAIARALIKNPRILMLDEATSALDAESEHLVQEALERIMKDRTVLTIAHRLSTVKNADQIVVLEKGKVVEKGTCEELMANENGAFRKLIKHQAFL